MLFLKPSFIHYKIDLQVRRGDQLKPGGGIEGKDTVVINNNNNCIHYCCKNMKCIYFTLLCIIF